MNEIRSFRNSLSPFPFPLDSSFSSRLSSPISFGTASSFESSPSSSSGGTPEPLMTVRCPTTRTYYLWTEEEDAMMRVFDPQKKSDWDDLVNKFGGGREISYLKERWSHLKILIATSARDREFRERSSSFSPAPLDSGPTVPSRPYIPRRRPKRSYPTEGEADSVCSTSQLKRTNFGILWTKEDDDKLYDLVSTGPRQKRNWDKLAEQFAERTSHALKVRWFKIKKLKEAQRFQSLVMDESDEKVSLSPQPEHLHLLAHATESNSCLTHELFSSDVEIEDLPTSNITSTSTALNHSFATKNDPQLSDSDHSEDEPLSDAPTPSIRKKWTPKEDALLLQLKDVQQLRFTEISKRFNRCTPIGVSRRYALLTNRKPIPRKEWTKLDDEKMLLLSTEGLRGSELARQFPERAASSVVSRLALLQERASCPPSIDDNFSPTSHEYSITSMGESSGHFTRSHASLRRRTV